MRRLARTWWRRLPYPLRRAAGRYLLKPLQRASWRLKAEWHSRPGLRLVTQSSFGRRLLFRRYTRRNRWGDAQSLSGPGSNLEQTAVLRAELPGLLRRHGIRSLVDAPCGDGHWFDHVDHGLDRYVGVDIVPELVRQRALASPGDEFLCCDVVSDPLPRADAILSRDFLVHLSERQVLQALRNMKASGARLLVTTHFPTKPNHDIATGRWRPVNLEAPPYDFPPPLDQIVEGALAPPYDDKVLAVWAFADLEL